MFVIAGPEAVPGPQMHSSEIPHAVVLLEDAPRALAIAVHAQFTTLVDQQLRHVGERSELRHGQTLIDVQSREHARLIGWQVDARAS